MATIFNDTIADHKWSTAANWSDGKPDASDAVTVHADVTALIIDEAASALSFSTAASSAGVAISGSGALSVYGDFTLVAADTWTNTGILSIYTNPCNFTSGANVLSTIASLHIRGGADVTLIDALNIGTKSLFVYGAGSSLVSGNFQIDCAVFGDNNQAGAITLTLGTSTINCTSISFASATLTVTHTGIINLSVSSTSQIYSGTGKTWGDLNITYAVGAGGGAVLQHASTFSTLTVAFNNSGVSGGNSLFLSASVVVTGAVTMTSDTIIGRPTVLTNTNTPGTQRTITAGSFTISGAIDFQDTKLIDSDLGDGVPINLSGMASGNLGGNGNITFRAPATYYLACEANASLQTYNNVFSAADDGTPDGLDVFPLPQDLLVINDNSFAGSGQEFLFHSGTRSGSVDASALTKTTTMNLPAITYGDILYSGSGVVARTITQNGARIDARLKNEGTDTLDIDILPSYAGGSISHIILSASGTVRLINRGWSLGGTLTLTRGTFDLNGQTLTCGVLSSSNTNTRTIQDSAVGGGGKIVLNGLTGTIWDLDSATASTITISNAPDIDIGDSNNTLTGDVTFEGGGKTYGDFKVTKHAGDFDCIVTGTNSFGALTLETPDATYQYSDLQLTSTTTQTITSLVADGTAAYTINLKAVTGASAAVLSDTSGTNTVSYCTIQDITVQGGATWPVSNGTNVSGNTGWTFISLDSAHGYGSKRRKQYLPEIQTFFVDADDSGNFKGEVIVPEGVIPIIVPRYILDKDPEKMTQKEFNMWREATRRD